MERNASLALNRELVAKSNASATVFDIVFMGAPPVTLRPLRRHVVRLQEHARCDMLP